jgi:hypothetical protein
MNPSAKIARTHRRIMVDLQFVAAPKIGGDFPIEFIGRWHSDSCRLSHDLGDLIVSKIPQSEPEGIKIPHLALPNFKNRPTCLSKRPLVGQVS